MSDGPRAFFLFGGNDLDVEPDLVSAAGYMEPVDVENGEYDAVFDDTGRRYRFWVAGANTRLERTSVVELDQLRARLRELAQLGVVPSGPGAEADDPLAVAAAISREKWERRWPRRPRWLSRRLHGSEPRIVR